MEEKEKTMCKTLFLIFFIDGDFGLVCFNVKFLDLVIFLRNNFPGINQVNKILGICGIQFIDCLR